MTFLIVFLCVFCYIIIGFLVGTALVKWFNCYNKRFSLNNDTDLEFIGFMIIVWPITIIVVISRVTPVVLGKILKWSLDKMESR